MRPFMKWLGGKTKLVPAIQNRLPHAKCLVEPFVGSGAVFLNTNYDYYILSDVNADLIHLYQTVQQYGEEFINRARKYFVPETNRPDVYYELRRRFNETSDLYEKDCLMVYINRHCFNGLIRYNQSGELNTPFGRYDKPYFPEVELSYFAEKSARATFMCRDFRDVIPRVKGDSVIYCDPPYIPYSETANFTAYSAGGFGYAEQVELAELAKETSERGIPVLISNHGGPVSKKLYSGSSIETLQVRRSVSRDGASRGKVDEILALYA